MKRNNECEGGNDEWSKRQREGIRETSSEGGSE